MDTVLEQYVSDLMSIDHLDPEGFALGDVNLPGCLGSALGGGLALAGRGGRTVTKSPRSDS